ncbi:anti-lipopolysaccharide factor-like [Penaeus chinensis]|uniref:anti-lipopolysaccharide factor-like n=1 Tax=Penaeus chinensis TaxID=139456 RepID=UPI001FB6101F|nr:anti-lipopolysaccharide factor-like [Penaeus chinensis]
MRSSAIISVLVLVLTPQCLANNERRELIFYLSRELLGQWLTTGANFLTHPCTLVVKPKLTNWMMNYEGIFSCPGWSDIEGKSITRCEMSTAERAVQNFLALGIDQHLFRRVDARIWLSQRFTIYQLNVTKTRSFPV